MPDHLNELLILKGELFHAPNPSRGGASELRKGSKVTSTHLKKLAQDLTAIQKAWDFKLLPGTILVTADYREIVAKSNRIARLIKPINCKHLSDLVCGARFEKHYDSPHPHHVIVYKTTNQAIETSIQELTSAAKFLDQRLAGFVTDQTIKTIDSTLLTKNGWSKTGFCQLIRDAYFVTDFRIGSTEESVEETQLVSLFQVGTQQSLIEILTKIGIRTEPARWLNSDTVQLYPDERKRLVEKASWLIAMEVSDLMEYVFEAPAAPLQNSPITIPAPKNEPVIGVIDTRFDSSVYFNRWVEYHDLIDPSITEKSADFVHGTSVTSLIVNGHRINPSLDDGCGFFRVRHFAVAQHGQVSSFDVLSKIRRIVRENTDIRVWNLSLGSKNPCPENFISPEGAELDRLQREYNVIFVVAGTNDTDHSIGHLSEKRIGAPADALNPVVVNSCDRNGNPAPYSRKGPVLHFYVKPDVSCFGGTNTDYLFVCTPNGREARIGTSFAAPWISRKLAYMIHYLRLSLTEAKALLIDSSIGWKSFERDFEWRGWGNVPTQINDIVRSANNEIRFIFSGEIDNYETFVHNIPVPTTANQTTDYDVRATLCYFPECRREQGVDYTLTELDLHIGRVDARNPNKVKIKSIDGNRQGDPVPISIPEEQARNAFRKWDNIKVRRQIFKRNLEPYNRQGFWGVSIYSKERLPEKYGQKMPFSLVVTLRSRNGENRISQFEKACLAQGWLVHRLNIQNRLTIATKMSQDIVFED